MRGYLQFQIRQCNIESIPSAFRGPAHESQRRYARESFWHFRIYLDQEKPALVIAVTKDRRAHEVDCAYFTESESAPITHAGMQSGLLHESVR